MKEGPYARVEHAYEVSRRSPGEYKLRLMLFCGGGMLAALALTGGLIWVSIFCEIHLLLIVPGAIILTVLFPLLFSGNRVQGDAYKLDRKRFAETYKKIGYISKLVKGPKITHIYIISELNVGVMRQLMFLPGLRRTVLLVGYPVLCLESARGMCGILAHELGHLSLNHPLYSRFIIGTLWFWRRIGQLPLGKIACPWLLWYLPAFDAWCAPLLRQFEEDADRFAREAFGEEDFREGMTLLAVYTERGNESDYLENYARTDLSVAEWRDYDLCAYYREFFGKPLPEGKGEKLLADVLKQPEIPDIAHPPYRQRLGSPDWRKYNPKRRDALEKTIPNYLELDKPLNNNFHKLFDAWRQAYVEQRKRAEELVQYRVKNPCKTVAEVGELAVAMGNSGREKDIMELTAGYLKKFPDNPMMLMYHGFAMSEHDKEGGFKLVRRALEQNPKLLPDVDQYYMYHLMEKGDEAGLREYYEFRDTQLKAFRKMKKVKIGIKAGDELEPLELAPGLKEELLISFSKIKMIKKAYLVRRYPLGRGYFPMDLVVLRLKSLSFSMQDSNGVLQMLARRFANNNLIFVAKSRSFCEKHLDLVDGAEIYDTNKIGSNRR